MPDAVLVGLSFVVALGAVAWSVVLARRLRARAAQRDTASRAAADAGRQLALAQTDLVRAEKLASVGLVAASVAHEVNNPAAYALANLTVAREAVAALGAGARRMALRSAASEQDIAALAKAEGGAVDALDDALDGLRRIRAAVASLGTLSQRGPRERSRVALSRVVAAAVSLVAPTVRGRVQVDLDLGADVDVSGQPNDLAQALIGVLLYAAEAMPEPRVGRVAVRTLVRGGDAMVDVHDDGPGIPPERLGSLFSSVEGAKPTGSGLGLPICRRIVEEHDGRIEVESVVGEGTTFRVLFPALPATEPARARPPRTAPAATATAPSFAAADGSAEAPLVLVVDDERLFVRVLERYLGRRYQVVATATADAAIALVSRGARPSVILCDLMMPGKTGADFYSALRVLAPELAERVTFMTGANADDVLRVFAERAGRPCLAKPIEPEDLLRYLEGVLGGATGAPAQAR